MAFARVVVSVAGKLLGLAWTAGDDRLSGILLAVYMEERMTVPWVREDFGESAEPSVLSCRDSASE